MDEGERPVFRGSMEHQTSVRRCRGGGLVAEVAGRRDPLASWVEESRCVEDGCQGAVD